MVTNKKSKKDKGNQLVKSLSRIGKITSLSALAKRAANWVKLEPNPDLKEMLHYIASSAEHAESLRLGVMKTLKQLSSMGYAPPKKSTSGELKFEPGRQVWIRQKFLPVYKEGGYTDEILGNLYVSNVVKGRVFLSIGKFDPNGTTATPLIPVPKIHVASTPAQGS